MNEKRAAALLVVLTGTETGKTFPITGPMTIGRDDGNDVPVSDQSVSRRHARIEPVADGFVVTDLGSRNKIVAGGKTAATHKLSLGDEFTIGSIRLKLIQSDGQETPPEHAIVPVPPKVPVAVQADVEAEALFEGPKKEKKGPRKSVIVLGLITLIALVVYALAPFFAAGPVVTRLDIVVDEGMTKAVGIWDPRAQVPRQFPLRVANKTIAQVSVDTGNGFIIKVVGNSRGVTEATGTNRSGGKTIINVVVKARADDIWLEQAKPDAEKKRTALYRIGRAADIESHSPYEAMNEYRVAARILESLNLRPREYLEAVLNEKRLREQIDSQIEEHVKAYRLAIRAKRYESATAELRKIKKLIPDSSDYRHQKAKLLYIRLSELIKQRSRRDKK